MGIKNRLIAVLSVLALCISAFTLTAAALDLDGDGYDDETGELIVVTPEETTEYVPETEYTEPEPDYTEPVSTEPDIYYTEPISSDPYYDDYTEPDTTEPTYYYVEETTNNNGGDSLYYSEDSDYYVGGGQEWYTVPVETAPSASLYESDREIDDNELSDSDWNEISANLKNASLSDSDGDDFGFIKNNSSSGDNGDWMLIVGIICLVLAAAGIAYTVISIVMARKKLGKPAYAAGGSSSASRTAARRATNDYGDGYRQSTQRNSRQKSRSSKFDTADVYVPKSTGGKRYSNSSNGKRYK